MQYWLEQLNPQQKEAVMHVSGPLFVVAGAGTGKTRTLTSRVAYLIQHQGIDPQSILAVTFTNKAAKEMKERIVDMTGPYAHSVWVYTFHSFGVQVLRQFIEKLGMGYTTQFNIIDEDDAKQLIKEVIKSLNLDTKEYRINAQRHKISSYKHLNINLFDDHNERKIYQLYQEMLLNQNLLDFDDLQVLTYRLLSESEEVKLYYQDKFSYILVDEFQDTDHLQYQMIKILAQKHKNLFVVGDPDQSIYAFRGANYENANHFKEDFGNEHILDLNYRSTPEILDYANKLIKYNQKRVFDKDLVADYKSGNKPVYAVAPTDFKEATIVANEIQRLTNDLGYQYEDIAILYRNNALSRIFEDTFIKYNIPYVIYGGISFYQRREIKDILAYIRLIANLDLDFYLKRIINVPRRTIGATTISKLEGKAQSLNISMFKAIDYVELSAKALYNLKEFKTLILEMQERLAQFENLGEIVMYVAHHSGYLAMLEADKDELSEARIENIKELKSVFVQGEEFYEGSLQEKLTQLLDQIALYTDLDKDDQTSSVKLSTYHQVKGLEFKVVFMVVLEEGIFPSPRSTFDPRDLEEERRIAYVGVTRAKERLYLTHSEQRLLYGQRVYPDASRFLKEMLPKEERLTKGTQVSAQATQENFLKSGDRIEHTAFGQGIVVGVEGDIATIAFKVPHGIKKIMQSHPSLKKS